jgi:hypothetical protein
MNGQDNILTIDANVFHCYFCELSGYVHPLFTVVKKRREFRLLLETYPIAINDFIKVEYENLIGPELTKNWLKKRLQNNLAVSVMGIQIPQNVRKRLRHEYGFDIYSDDMKYLETCNGTHFRHLVTENTSHFFRKHKNRRRQGMDRYIERVLNIFVYRTDQCCSILQISPAS